MRNYSAIKALYNRNRQPQVACTRQEAGSRIVASGGAGLQVGEGRTDNPCLSYKTSVERRLHRQLRGLSRGCSEAVSAEFSTPYGIILPTMPAKTPTCIPQAPQTEPPRGRPRLLADERQRRLQERRRRSWHVRREKRRAQQVQQPTEVFPAAVVIPPPPTQGARTDSPREAPPTQAERKRARPRLPEKEKKRRHAQHHERSTSHKGKRGREPDAAHWPMAHYYFSEVRRKPLLRKPLLRREREIADSTGFSGKISSH
jgi:hypothetical protein